MGFGSMDNLTHTATGLFLSRAGLNRTTPLAAPILMLAANAPDIDVLSAAGGGLNYLHYHRHLTHSFMAAPVMALLPLLLVRLVARKPIRWVPAYIAALIAVMSHLLLDLTNVYGIRLLLPFSERWMRLDLTSVVDIWIWAALLLGIVAPFLGKLVGSEISSGAVRMPSYGRGWACFGLGFLLIYNYGRSVLHTRATAVLESRQYQTAAPLSAIAMPDALNPLHWRGVVETANFFAEADVNLAGEFDPTRATIFHKPEPDPVLDIVRAAPVVQEFLRFSQVPFWRISPVPQPEGARQVEVIDMRFGSPLHPGFEAAAVVTTRNQVVETSFQFGRLRPR
jgi:inner membrane protein